MHCIESNCSTYKTLNNDINPFFMLRTISINQNLTQFYSLLYYFIAILSDNNSIVVLKHGIRQWIWKQNKLQV